jgi:hypothetical protein
MVYRMMRIMVMRARMMMPMAGRSRCGARETNEQSHDDDCRN